MKLHPPIPEIPEDAPYSNDLFDRKQFGDSLSSLFTTVDESVVLSIDAPWGDGKTTFRSVSTCLRHLRDGISVFWTRFASGFPWMRGPAPTPPGFFQA